MELNTHLYPLNSTYFIQTDLDKLKQNKKEETFYF